MNRRDTVLALLALGAAPLAAEAQQPAKLRCITWLSLGSPESGHFLDVVKQALRELGFVEGKNVVFEARYAFGKAELLRPVWHENLSRSSPT
jgi:putative ABC transport system substrate-binding protein